MAKHLEEIGVLTAGGSSPGNQDAIIGATHAIEEAGFAPIGIPKGWEGMIEGYPPLPIRDFAVKRSVAELEDLRYRAGTVLRTSRMTPRPKNEPWLYTERKQAIESYRKKYGLRALIAIGGDDTLTGASIITHDPDVHMPVNGVPKSMDNDYAVTDKTFGFDTAVTHAAKYLRDLENEAFDAEGVAVLELFGRDAGHVAGHAARKGEADFALLSEPYFEIPTEELIDKIVERYRKKQQVVIALGEGYHMNGKQIYRGGKLDESGHGKLGGVGYELADIIAREMKKRLHKMIAMKVVAPTYLIRSCNPTREDANLAYAFGRKAVEALLAGQEGYVACMRRGGITAEPLPPLPNPEDRIPQRLVQKEEYDRENLMLKNGEFANA